jgi:ABC-type transport system substrate-binding protein
MKHARTGLLLVAMAMTAVACGAGSGAASPQASGAAPAPTAAAPSVAAAEPTPPASSDPAAPAAGSGQAAPGTVAVSIDGSPVVAVKIVACTPFTVASDGSTGVTVMASDENGLATVVVPTIPGQIAGTIGDRDFALTKDIESTTDGETGQFKGVDEAAGTTVVGSYTCP